VADVIGIAFGELGLHQLEASTLLHNTPSQRVLARNGFRPFAVAEAYLNIAGKWQDHVMFRLLNQQLFTASSLIAGRAGVGAARPAILKPGRRIRSHGRSAHASASGARSRGGRGVGPPGRYCGPPGS
jgi:hypothetical protein